MVQMKLVQINLLPKYVSLRLWHEVGQFRRQAMGCDVSI